MANARRTGKAIEPPQAIHDCHALLLWIIPQLDKFPRLRRYTLGERIETLLLQVLERLLEAAYSSGRDKTRALQRASQHLNVVRHLWRLSHELKAVPPRAHAHGAERLVQLGRQLGAGSGHLSGESPLGTQAGPIRW